MLVAGPLEVSNDAGILLDMLPEDLREALLESSENLSDITLDKGRKPQAWIKGERKFLGKEDRKIESSDIDCIVEQLGGFGLDNRAGLEQQLHRISAIRNRKSDIIGLTMRVGRHVNGNATMIADLLFESSARCILFMGEPGSGKTTVVREVTRLLAERFNVFIVDTSNEIAGDGDIPHPCVGLARRMMVPILDKQGDIMIECVQNHTPEVMVIDEIGRPSEVEAARTCKQRGVRLIASAHGDLRKLTKNPKLRGLVGGIETVTLGDAQAKVESKKKKGSGIQKLKAQRAGAPVFDTIVELRRGAHHEWSIIMDVASAVDKVLEGAEYPTQRRIRDPKTGAIQLHLEKA
jgi:stage III sporulation protein SpoIIIAA